MKKIAALLFLATLSCLQAQDIVRKVFQLKYAEPSRVKNFMLGSERLNFDDELKTIAVEATRTRMTEFEEIVKRFDVPPPAIPNIEVTIYLMSALAQPAAATIPPELEGVVKQLRGMFSYKGYQLIDTQVIRVRAGQGGQASGVVDRNTTGQPKTLSEVKFNSAKVSIDEKGRALHIDGLRVGLKMPLPLSRAGDKGEIVNYANTGIFTDVDVHEGQKVVVGKANMDGSDRASIVVLTAQVVD